MTEHPTSANGYGVFEDVYARLRQGDYDTALNFILEENGCLRSPFKSNPNHTWYVVGDILFKLGRYLEAIVAFRKSLRSRNDDVDALWAIGDAYSEIGRPRLAERYFRKALANDEDRVEELLYNLGNALFDQGKYDEAIGCYLKVEKQNESLWAMASRNIELSKERQRKNKRKPLDKNL